MALDTFISGRYAHTYNSVDTGITDDDGYALEQQTVEELIDDSDAYGGTIIDWIWRGRNVTLEYTGKAYKAGSIVPYTIVSSALGILTNAANPIGRLASNLAVASVLTAVANTPAEASPASLTASKALLAPGYPVKLLFTTKLRKVPVKLQLLPYDAGSGVLRHFSMT
jgi:hypothetical protein